MTLLQFLDFIDELICDDKINPFRPLSLWTLREIYYSATLRYKEVTK